MPSSLMFIGVAVLALGLLAFGVFFLRMIWQKPKPSVWTGEIIEVKAVAAAEAYRKTAVSVRRLAHSFKLLAAKIGPKWLDDDPPSWDWPCRRRPTPQSPFNWRIH